MAIPPEHIDRYEARHRFQAVLEGLAHLDKDDLKRCTPEERKAISTVFNVIRRLCHETMDLKDFLHFIAIEDED